MEENTKKVEYLFDVGDIVKTKKGCNLVSLYDNKPYKEHLKVTSRFWDGKYPCYVLETEDELCVISDESTVELEWKYYPPVCEQEEQEPIDGRDKKLYLVRNGLGNFHVIAHSFDEAADVLKGAKNIIIIKGKISFRNASANKQSILRHKSALNIRNDFQKCQNSNWIICII